MEAERVIAVNEGDDAVRAVRAYLDGPISLAETTRVRDAIARYEAIVREAVAEGGPSEDAFAHLYEDAFRSERHTHD